MHRIFLLCLIMGIFSGSLRGEWWDNGEFDWSEAKRLNRAVVYINVKKSSPRLMNMWFMRIDLNQVLTFHVSGRSPEYGKVIPTHKHLKIHTLRQTVTDFMEEARRKNINMVVAVNAPPWQPWDKVASKYATNMGLLVSNGTVVSPVMEGRPTLVFYKNGRIDIKIFRKNEKLNRVKNAVSGFFMVLVNGKTGLIPGDKSLAPRTGFGLSEKRNYLYFVVIDGRQKKFSMGCTVDELGKIMKYLGAFDGINMDGGGSSSLVIWNKRKNRAEMLNHQPGGSVRPVGASIGIEI